MIITFDPIVAFLLVIAIMAKIFQFIKEGKL